MRPRRGWKLTHLAREANLNLLTPKLISLVLIAFCLGALGPAIGMQQSAALRENLDALELQGRNLITFAGTSKDVPAAITRQSCEALTSNSAVVKSGIIVQVQPVSSAQLGANVPVFQASTGWFPQLRDSDAVVGASVSQVPLGKSALLESGQLLDVAVAPVQPEGMPTNRAIVVPLPASVIAAPSCIAQLGPFESPRDKIPELVAALKVQGAPISAQVQLSQQVDLVEQYRSSSVTLVPLLLGLLGGVVSALVNASRSREFATYRLSGTSKVQLLTLLCLEQSVVSAVVTAAGVVASVATSAVMISPLEYVLYAVAAGGTWMVTSIALSLRGALTSAAVLAKDR